MDAVASVAAAGEPVDGDPSRQYVPADEEHHERSGVELPTGRTLT
jgi:hypothetical protein